MKAALDVSMVMLASGPAQAHTPYATVTFIPWNRMFQSSIANVVTEAELISNQFVAA